MFMHTHAYLCHFPKCININMHVFYITVILIFSLISAHSPPTPPSHHPSHTPASHINLSSRLSSDHSMFLPRFKSSWARIVYHRLFQQNGAVFRTSAHSTLISQQYLMDVLQYGPYSFIPFLLDACIIEAAASSHRGRCAEGEKAEC